MESPVPLEELLQAESAWVEWKKTGDPLDIVAKLVAFANDVADRRRSGWVVCGIEETKDEHGIVQPNIVGVTQGELSALKGKVLDACANYVSPPIYPDVIVAPAPHDASRFVLRFHVYPTGRVHSHTTKQGTKVWIVRDSHTHEAKGEELRELHVRRGVAPHLLERLAYNDALGSFATLDDIYMLAADEFRRLAKLPRPTADYFIPDEQLDATTPSLCKRKEIAFGQVAVVPRLFAILLFGHAPTKFIPGAYAIVSIYPGTSRTTPDSERFEFAGPLTKIIADVIDKLKGYMGVFMDKSRSGLQIQQNRQRYSETAVQEAVLNAFAHRDYEDREATRITVFSDRIEVVSPGGMPFGLDTEKIERGQSVGSHWRNPSLAGFLRRMRLGVQAEGQGIPKIYEETVDTAERPPEYEIKPHWVKVTIPAYHPLPPPPKPSPPLSADTPPRDGIILISIGGPSLRAHVESWLGRLDLADGEIIADISHRDYVESTPDAWYPIAEKIRTAMMACVNNSVYTRLHLFYRGPVVLTPLIGAIVAGSKPLVIYGYMEGVYYRALTIDRRFLLGVS